MTGMTKVDVVTVVKELLAEADQQLAEGKAEGVDEYDHKYSFWRGRRSALKDLLEKILD